MSKKRDVWSDKETLELLAAWGTEEIQKKLQGTHKNTDIYKRVKAVFQLRVFHMYVHARKTLNPFQYYI